jgi:Protein of unknown function (DUF2917)
MGFMLQESEMDNDLLLGARPLDKGRVRRVPAAFGRRVECLSGSLWITQDGDARDVVLGAGEGFEFDRTGDALVSALADSRYLMLQACARPHA